MPCNGMQSTRTADSQRTLLSRAAVAQKPVGGARIAHEDLAKEAQADAAMAADEDSTPHFFMTQKSKSR